MLKWWRKKENDGTILDLITVAVIVIVIRLLLTVVGV
jgi:hypothetical protein